MNTRKRLVVRAFLEIAVAVLCLLFVCGAAWAQGEIQAPEARVKAAFLFKFGSYVEWPAGTFDSAAAPFTMGVMDDDALADELTTIVAGRNIDGRPVSVRKLHEGDPIAGLHVLFVGKADGSRLPAILSALKGRSTLAVTESNGALDQGSTINFVIVDGKVRFDVSLPAAATGNLKVSSRLLAVARRVVGAS